MRDKRCVVVGGGRVALRKVKRLLACGARVALVSPQLSDGLDHLKNAGRLEHINAGYEEEHLIGAFLVIGATDDKAINDKIAQDAGQRGALVSIADAPARSDFILPSVVNRGDLTIAVSTSGSSPALALKLREEIESCYGAEYGTLLEIMGRLRELIIAQGKPAEENQAVFWELIRSRLLCFIRDNDVDAAGQTIFDLTGVKMDVSPFMKIKTGHSISRP